MKRRTGLVSNSSSSSYIIAIKKESNCNTCPTCGIGTLDLLHWIDASYDERTNLVNTENEVIYSLRLEIKELRALKEKGEVEEYDLVELDERREALKEVEKWNSLGGWNIAEVEISYHDHLLQHIFQGMQKLGNLKVIQDWES